MRLFIGYALMPEGLRGLTPDELEMWIPPKVDTIISDYILPVQGVLGIYGMEGSYKSLLMIDLMYKIATGQDWFGFKTNMTSTYYFQTEIPQAMLQQRSRAYRIGNRMNTKNCWLATDLYLKIDKGSGSTLMETELARTNPGLLIVDPLNTSISGNMNEEYDSGVAIDRFNMWRKNYKIAMVLIHHPRKQEHVEGQVFHYGTDEWGGSGRWKKWMDSIIYLELVNNGDPYVDLKLTFEKTRHSHIKLNPFGVRLDRRTLVFERAELAGTL